MKRVTLVTLRLATLGIVVGLVLQAGIDAQAPAHGDHVGGVVASPRAADLASKTMLTRVQLQTLMTAPQMPEIRLTTDAARRYTAVDYDDYYPVAPGMALIESGVLGGRLE